MNRFLANSPLAVVPTTSNSADYQGDNASLSFQPSGAIDGQIQQELLVAYSRLTHSNCVMLTLANRKGLCPYLQTILDQTSVVNISTVQICHEVGGLVV